MQRLDGWLFVLQVLPFGITKAINTKAWLKSIGQTFGSDWAFWYEFRVPSIVKQTGSDWSSSIKSRWQKCGINPHAISNEVLFGKYETRFSSLPETAARRLSSQANLLTLARTEAIFNLEIFLLKEQHLMFELASNTLLSLHQKWNGKECRVSMISKTFAMRMDTATS